MNVSRVHVDPRIRERRIAVQRALGRRRLRILIVCSTAIVTLGLAFLVVHSPLLDVDRVQVVGTHELTAANVRGAARVHVHSPLMFLDTGAVARRVETLPWVERVSVRRDFPGTVRIVVTEYTPTAYVRVGNSVVLIAANGRAIARVSRAPAGIVEVRGLRAAPAAGELLSPPEAANIVPRLPVALAQQVRAVDVSDAGIALVVARGGVIRFGNADDLDAKGAAALAVLTQHGDTPFSYIDVSTPSTPVLHP
jgi:cell division protein FtsQ